VTADSPSVSRAPVCDRPSSAVGTGGTGWQPCLPDEPGPKVLLEHWGIRALRAERLRRESANTLWRVHSDRGAFVLKALGQPGTEAWLAFQLAAGELAADAGIPLTQPVKTASGSTTVHTFGQQWQLRPYQEGQAFAAEVRGHLEQAAGALRTLHRLPTAALPGAPPSPSDETSFWLGAGEEEWAELDRQLARVLTPPERTATLSVYRDVHSRALAELDGCGYDTLPAVLTHGEVAGSNLVFDEAGRLCAVLDWDAVQLRPRVYDLGKAALFLGRLARGSLDLAPGRATAVVLDSVLGQPLEACEIEALTPLMELYFVPTPERLRQMLRTSSQHVEWYVGWTADGARRTRGLLAPVLARLTETSRP
jgi:Ser/Thr protein kinase RdoA (MazF antagonist)